MEINKQTISKAIDNWKFICDEYKRIEAELKPHFDYDEEFENELHRLFVTNIFSEDKVDREKFNYLLDSLNAEWYDVIVYYSEEKLSIDGYRHDDNLDVDYITNKVFEIPLSDLPKVIENGIDIKDLSTFLKNREETC